MPKLNAVLMVVLSAAVIGALGWRALGQGDGGAAERARAAKIVRKLADPDPDLRREAESEIKSLGLRGKEILRETAKGPDARLAERAVAMLKEMEPAAPEPAPVELVGLEHFIWCTDRFIVEFRNSGSEPILLALEKKGEEPRFGWFEVMETSGRTHVVRPESYAPPVVEGAAHVVALPPGAKQVLYTGWESVSALLNELPGPCKVRFVYDATEGSAYREVAKVSPRGVPLKPARYASAPAETDPR
ncbi:MAG TPA: hypothetical protein VF950_29585 [Planctomycetota bacterium]